MSSKEKWSAVGGWLKDNAGTGAVLVGSILTGNVPAAVAAGAALVSSATGESDPAKVLEAFQKDPGTVLRLKELAVQNDADIRKHVEAMARLDFEKEAAELADQQHQHEQQQATIRAGDQAQDKFVRWTRPGQAWFFSAVSVAWAFVTRCDTDLELYVLMVFISYPAAYAGFRTADKVGDLIGQAKVLRASQGAA